MTHKIAFIGPKKIHDGFTTLDETWDLQVPLETLDDFEDELMAEPEDARISRDTNVIIYFSRLFDSNPEKFAELVSFTSPYSVVCILIPRADLASKKQLIEQAVRKRQLQDAREDSEYNSSTPFYFTIYEEVPAAIFESINSFVNNGIIAKDIRESVQRMLPSLALPVEDDYVDTVIDEWGDDNVPIEFTNQGKGKILVTTSFKGGAGKSTVAILLGAYLARASKLAVEQGLRESELKVCIVDFDAHNGQLGFLNNTTKPSVVNIFVDGLDRDPKQSIEKGLFHSSKLGLDFIFASKRPENAKEIPPSFYARLVDELKTMYDYVILDTSANSSDPLRNKVAYPVANVVMFVAEMVVTSIMGLYTWATQFVYSDREYSINEDKVCVVINKALADINMPPQKIEAAARGLPIVSMIPSSPRLVSYAANTYELGQLLNVRGINEALKDLTEAILEDEVLAEIPSR